MNLDLIPALALFAFVTSITPGPNNLMLLASGANFGVRRTVPHMLGVGIGFTVMVVGIGMGLVTVFDRYPVTHQMLTAASIVYLLYLAWKIATAAPKERTEATGRPITFLQAAAFQWVNPKAWAMGLSAISAYTAEQTLAGVALVAVVFGLVNIPSVACWVVLGHEMRRILTNPGRLRAFNVTMAVLLVASLVPLIDFGAGWRG